MALDGVVARNLQQPGRSRKYNGRTVNPAPAGNSGLDSHRRTKVKLRYLGKTSGSDDGDCPALYATDRGTFVVQGKVVADPEAVAGLRDLGPDESYVEVPEDVLRLVDRA